MSKVFCDSPSPCSYNSNFLLLLGNENLIAIDATRVVVMTHVKIFPGEIRHQQTRVQEKHPPPDFDINIRINPTYIFHNAQRHTRTYA
jgi:hypothetical protein